MDRFTALVLVPGWSVFAAKGWCHVDTRQAAARGRDTSSRVRWDALLPASRFPINLELQLFSTEMFSLRMCWILAAGWPQYRRVAIPMIYVISMTRPRVAHGQGGQADHRTTIGCSALRGTRMIYLCSFIERPLHLPSHYPHHSAVPGWPCIHNGRISQRLLHAAPCGVTPSVH